MHTSAALCVAGKSIVRVVVVAVVVVVMVGLLLLQVMMVMMRGGVLPVPTAATCSTSLVGIMAVVTV